MDGTQVAHSDIRTAPCKIIYDNVTLMAIM